jgi:hypothetical protein
VRTTLSLADDVFLFARERAAIEHKSIGDTISKYVRLGMKADSVAVNHRKPKSEFSIFPTRDEVITSEHVYRLMEQEGI